VRQAVQRVAALVAQPVAALVAAVLQGVDQQPGGCCR